MNVYKIFLAIVVGSLIIGVSIYFSLQRTSDKKFFPTPTQCLFPTKVIVTKVIDGDTVVVEGGYHIRLLGIDADESGYSCYKEAKARLEDLILNKEVKLEKDVTDIDQYGRCLRYIFLDGQNIPLQLVKEGLAVCRFYEPDTQYNKACASFEKEAIENKIGCKWSGTESPLSELLVKFEKFTTKETGLEVISACSAENYYGKEKIIAGKIVSTYRSKTNTVFLNFEKPYPNQCFTAVIFSSDQYKFVGYPEKYYEDKTVRIRGEIKEYQGKPEIILKDPSQIEIGKTNISSKV